MIMMALYVKNKQDFFVFLMALNSDFESTLFLKYSFDYRFINIDEFKLWGFYFDIGFYYFTFDFPMFSKMYESQSLEVRMQLLWYFQCFRNTLLNYITTTNKHWKKSKVW